MLMEKPTAEMIQEWKRIFNEYKGRLLPNRKNSVEIIAYLKAKYPTVEIADKKWKKMISSEITGNKPYAEKLPEGKETEVVIFEIANKDAAVKLYDKQDDIFKGQKIYVGIELETAHIHVEGSSLLSDELFTFRGLDKADLENYFMVSEYIIGLKKFGLLDEVLKTSKHKK